MKKLSGKDRQRMLKLKGKRLLGNWVLSVEVSASYYDTDHKGENTILQ